MKFITATLMLAMLVFTTGCDTTGCDTTGCDTTGCDTTETKDLEVDFSGRYEATKIIFDSTGERDDAFAGGLTFWIELDKDGTITGEAFIPAIYTEGEVDETTNLAGTWTNVEDVVSFGMDADTFIKNVDWTFNVDTKKYVTDTSSGYEVELTKN